MSIEIIGWNEYQNLIARNKQQGFLFSGNEIHYFHREFINLLEESINLEDNIIMLDHIQSFSDFPSGKGIYFCARWTHPSNKEIWYVGKTQNFRSRWRNHHKYQALRTIQEVIVYCLPLDNYSDNQISKAEQIYIDMLKPIFNNTSNPEKHLRIAT